MDSYEEKLIKFIKERGINAEHMSFNASCHSVEEAAIAANADPHDFVKNICLVAPDGTMAVAIVKGEDRVSTSRVARVLGVEQTRLARPDEILRCTGYPCGGTPSFGFDAVFLMDPNVFDKAIVYTGGGSTTALV